MSVAIATTAFFSLIKQKILQNILVYFINRFGIIYIQKPIFATKYFNMKAQDAVLYIMGMIMIVMILLFFLQIFTSGK